LTPVETGRVAVDADASVTGWLARAAAERNKGVRRTLAARIRRKKNLLDVDSNHHNIKPETIRLSNIFYKSLFMNNLNGNIYQF
jgi:hypothetical protein